MSGADGYTMLVHDLFAVPPGVGCYNPADGGLSYEGGAVTTVGGFTCQEWHQDFPHAHNFNHLLPPVRSRSLCRSKFGP